MTPVTQKIFSCPGCSLRVSGQESACPRCGMEFGHDVKLECPFCGTLVSPNSDTCPSCQIDYLEFVGKAEERLLEKALDRIVDEIQVLVIEEETREERSRKDGESAPEPMLPEEDQEAVCPVCMSVVKVTDDSCPGCGAIFEMDTLDEPIEPEEQACCPICGDVVGMDVPICPSCGAEFEPEEEAIHDEPAPEPVKIFKRPRLGISRKDPMAVSTETRAREAIGLSNGVSLTNGIGKTNGQSKVNGTSQINGIHLVNGRGVVNGREHINGTGILNGSGARRHHDLEGSKRAPFYVRWQFVAILTTIAILAPSLLHYVHTGDEPPYSIDGDFSDWESSTMFTVVGISTDHDTAVMEWSVDDYGDCLYLYVRTAENLMARAEAERLVLFVDGDDSDQSGYTVGGVGADFMIEISGWNGTVRSSVLTFFDSDDQLDWSKWSNPRHVTSKLIMNQLEAKAELPTRLNDSARFVLTAQNERSVTCISHPVATDGALLIVEQQPGQGVSAEGILRRGGNADFLRIKLTCQGGGGLVENIVPTFSWPASFEPMGQFSIEVGDEHYVDLRVDSSPLSEGQFVSATINETSITSSFDHVRIVGDPVRAYAFDFPNSISVDGAFADWENRTVSDSDGAPLCNPNVDIDEVGSNTTDENSYFFVSVRGEMCAGAYVPKICAIPVGTGGGTVVPVRRTAEDFIRIYIDSDRSSASGRIKAVGSLTIGADQMIEVRGLCCEIVSIDVYWYISDTWARTSVSAEAAKDAKRVEVGVPADAIGRPESVDFLIESTDWRGETDYASNETTLPWARTWAVDSSGTSQYATSLSYQRKLFHDGTNFWSFYFDGSETVCSFSNDEGETWTSRGSVFKTSGVRDVSIWYDSDDNVVYAVGDTASSTRYIYVQKGSVNSGSATISWATSDSTPTVSTESTSMKNSYISMDMNGYLWMLCTDLTRTSPQVKYQLGSWQSSSANDITAWTARGDLLPTAQTQDSDLCGSVVPAGTESDVWAIFAYDGKVMSKKRTSGAWESSEQTIYSESGSQDENTVHAPPSVVVDSNGVVHVVYGDIYEEGGYSKPAIWYTHNQTGATTWATNIDLDSSKPVDVGNKYPTISIDTATDDLYAFWVRTDNSSVPQTIMGKKNAGGGSWTSLSLGTQTSCTKHYLTSIYNVSGESMICWLWTQNTTGTIEVFFDVIPEFGDVAIPVFTLLVMFAVLSRTRRGRKRCAR